MTYEEQAKLVDDYAWGDKVDRQGYLKALNRPDLRLYEQAKHDGFVTSGKGQGFLARLYRHWCTAENTPMIELRPGRKYATITYDADPTG